MSAATWELLCEPAEDNGSPSPSQVASELLHERFREPQGETKRTVGSDGGERLGRDRFGQRASRSASGGDCPFGVVLPGHSGDPGTEGRSRSCQPSLASRT